MKRLLLSTLTLSLAALIAGAGGCATTSSAPSNKEAAIPLLVGADAYHATKVYTGTGEATDWKTIEGAARSADVVILAEQHGHPIGLSAAAALWRSILTNAGGGGEHPALALEFFERDDQSRIDDYLTGMSTEEVFLKRTGRTAKPDSNPWAGSYPPGHRDMIEAAKAASAPVYAANAPRAYVRLARTKGYAAVAQLTPEQQRLVVLPRFAADGARPDNRYWHDFLKFMGTTPEMYATSSAEEREKADAMFRSQSVWDATMADTVRQALAGGHTPVVLVVGQFHADYSTLGGGGTYQALKAVRPDTRIVVISFQASDDAKSWKADDKDRADFIVYTGKNMADKDDDEALTTTPSKSTTTTSTTTPTAPPASPHTPTPAKK